MYLFCNSRIHVITLYSGHVCVYYASILQCCHLVWILVRTGSSLLRGGMSHVVSVRSRRRLHPTPDSGAAPLLPTVRASTPPDPPLLHPLSCVVNPRSSRPASAPPPPLRGEPSLLLTRLCSAPPRHGEPSLLLTRLCSAPSPAHRTLAPPGPPLLPTVNSAFLFTRS
jgi:hypothetical protein